MTVLSASALVGELSSHPHLAAVTERIRRAALAAAEARNARPQLGDEEDSSDSSAQAGASNAGAKADSAQSGSDAAKADDPDANPTGEGDAAAESGEGDAAGESGEGDAAAESGEGDAAGEGDEAAESGEGDEAAKNGEATAAADPASQDRADAKPGNATKTGAPGFDRSQGDTEWGNAFDALESDSPSAEQAALVSALLAISLASELPSAPEDELELGTKLVWLATHTPFNALVAADAALGDKAGALWQAVSTIAGSPSKVARDFGRCEGLVAAAALGASESESAAAAREQALKKARDPLVIATLRDHTTHTDTLQGELGPRPHGPVVTALLAVTLVLFVVRVWGVVARLALAYKRPAKLVIGPRGLELQWRTELLGKVLRDRSQLIPLSNLARVTREVKYSRLGLYAGLLAMALGTYLGMGLFVDAVRVPGGSLPLLSMAVLLVALGLVIDFAMSSLADSSRGKCRVVVVPRKGRALAIGALDPRQADAMLNALAERGVGAS